MVPNAKISLISRKPKERLGYGAQRQNFSFIKKTKEALWLWCLTPKSQLYQENQRSVRIMVPNAKISVLSRKPKERYGYGAQRQNLSYIKKTKGALGLWCPTPKFSFIKKTKGVLGLWCPTPKSQLYQENQRSFMVMVPNAKISVISRKPKER